MLQSPETLTNSPWHKSHCQALSPMDLLSGLNLYKHKMFECVLYNVYFLTVLCPFWQATCRAVCPMASSTSTLVTCWTRSWRSSVRPFTASQWICSRGSHTDYRSSSTTSHIDGTSQLFHKQQWTQGVLRYSAQHEPQPEDYRPLTAVSPSLLQMLTSALNSNSLPMHFFCLREQWRKSV